MRKTLGIIITIMFFAGSAGITLPANAYAAENQKEYQNTRYAEGGIYEGLYQETIYYHSRQEAYYKIDPALPGYPTNTCGLTAGGNIVGWYNHLYPELFPGHTAMITYFGTDFWASPTPALAAGFNQLESDMGITSAGVTISGYLGGLNTYVTGKGRTFSSSSVMGSGGALLNSSYKTELKKDRLMTIFVDGFNIMDITNIKSYPSLGYDKVTMEKYSGAHVMAVYGYYELTYLDSGKNLLSKDIYLIVHTGFGSLLGMIRLTSQCTLDAAYITYIY